MPAKRSDEEKFVPVLLREGFGVLTIGWDLAIPIFAGVLVGHALDVWLRSGYLFTLGLLTLGVIVAYFNLLRLIQRDRQDQEKKRREEELGER